MAHHGAKSKKSKKGAKKKNKARVASVFPLPLPHDEAPFGETENASVYRACAARLAAAFRHAFARAGAAVGINAAAALIVNQSRVQPFEGGEDFVSASSSAARLTLSAETGDSAATTSPPTTGADDNSSTTSPPTTGTSTFNLLPSGTQGIGTAPVPASNSDSSPPTVSAKNSRTSRSGSAPTTNCKDTAPHLELKPATASPPKGAKNSCSAKNFASAPRQAAKPATLSQQTPPSAGTKTHGLAKKGGSGDYHLSWIFENDECFVEEDDAVFYARFCFKRANSLLNKKDTEICHICFFEYDGKVTICKKDKVEGHCQSRHKNGTYLCEKEGCFIRTSSSQEAGRHHYFCHEKYHDWWVDCLKRHGEM